MMFSSLVEEEDNERIVQRKMIINFIGIHDVYAFGIVALVVFDYKDCLGFALCTLATQ